MRFYLHFATSRNCSLPNISLSQLKSSYLWFMRLKPEEIEFIKKQLSPIQRNAEIYLFGSRTDDQAKGGDIDLLLLSEKPIKRADIRRGRIFWFHDGKIFKNHRYLYSKSTAFCLDCHAWTLCAVHRFYEQGWERQYHRLCRFNFKPPSPLFQHETG